MGPFQNLQSSNSPSPHPIQSWNSEKNSWYTRPTLFVGWEEGLGPCELENAEKYSSVPRLFSTIVVRMRGIPSQAEVCT